MALSLRSTLVGVAVATLATSMVLAGCSSSKHAAASTSTTRGHASTTSSSSSTSAPSSTTTTAGPATSSTTAAGPSACATNQLSASLGAGQGAAGHLITPLVLTNKSSSPCVVQGYPGVSLLDAHGAAIGSPATRASRPATPLVLAAGAGAQTDLETQDQGISPAPCWAPSTSIKVFPPNQLTALTIAGVIQVCGNEFTVTPMGSS